MSPELNSRLVQVPQPRQEQASGCQVEGATSTKVPHVPGCAALPDPELLEAFASAPSMPAPHQEHLNAALAALVGPLEGNDTYSPDQARQGREVVRGLLLGMDPTREVESFLDEHYSKQWHSLSPHVAIAMRVARKGLPSAKTEVTQQQVGEILKDLGAEGYSSSYAAESLRLMKGNDISARLAYASAMISEDSRAADYSDDPGTRRAEKDGCERERKAVAIAKRSLERLLLSPPKPGVPGLPSREPALGLKKVDATVAIFWGEKEGFSCKASSDPRLAIDARGYGDFAGAGRIQMVVPEACPLEAGGNPGLQDPGVGRKDREPAPGLKKVDATVAVFWGEKEGFTCKVSTDPRLAIDARGYEDFVGAGRVQLVVPNECAPAGWKERDPGLKKEDQSYWLYDHGRMVTTVRGPAGMDDDAVRVLALDQHNRVPLYDPERAPFEVVNAIQRSTVKVYRVGPLSQRLNDLVGQAHPGLDEEARALERHVEGLEAGRGLAPKAVDSALRELGTRGAEGTRDLAERARELAQAAHRLAKVEKPMVEAGFMAQISPRLALRRVVGRPELSVLEENLHFQDDDTLRVVSEIYEDDELLEAVDARVFPGDANPGEILDWFAKARAKSEYLKG